MIGRQSLTYVKDLVGDGGSRGVAATDAENGLQDAREDLHAVGHPQRLRDVQEVAPFRFPVVVGIPHRAVDELEVAQAIGLQLLHERGVVRPPHLQQHPVARTNGLCKETLLRGIPVA